MPDARWRLFTTIVVGYALAMHGWALLLVQRRADGSHKRTPPEWLMALRHELR